MEINSQATRVERKEIFIQASPDQVWPIQTNVNAWKNLQLGIRRSQISGTLSVNALSDIQVKVEP